MNKFWAICCVVVVTLSESYGVPQGRRIRHQEQQLVRQQVLPQMDPVAAEQGLNDEHAKLIENLQRLKRTLETVKEKVNQGKLNEPVKTDMANPESAILTVLKSLQEQGQLFSMINDMLKAGSVVQNQTAKVQAYSELEEQAHAEAALADRTNEIAPPPAPVVVPSAPSPALTRYSVPSVSSTRSSPTAAPRRDSNNGKSETAKQQGYEDYHYQYRDDSGDATGDDQYEYHYDASGYEEAPAKTTTTTTTTTTKRPRRIRTRGRNDYY